MKSPLHILHLEDDAADAALVRATLIEDGIACIMKRVQNQADFAKGLEQPDLDLIISDFSLPGFNGLAALKLAHAKCPAIPLIFVSGTLGEERAVDSLKSGATDYVLKDRLSRLGPAVRRAMAEVENRAERERLEAQFIEAQKMEVIGQLAGGIAHDFNNILAVIMGYADLTMQAMLRSDAHWSHLETIRSAAQRASGLTRQLLIFSRKQTVKAVVLDLNEIVKDSEKMLQRLIDENVEMVIAPGEKVGHVKADAGYVGQVVMNLVVNARDAMPNGGKVTIATSNATLDEDYAQTHPGARAGKYVMFSVSDTGTGMTEEVKEHLFEAFFTTKPKGKGTGLGLATCQTIIQQSGGHIHFESELSKGTTFKVYFPRVDQPLDEGTRRFHKGELPRGTETLLVVEDEPSVRHLARTVLEAQGYVVITAPNGQDALHAVRDHKGPPIQLVITDVIMPQMGGKVMAEWLKTTYPQMQILFTSGYTEEAITERDAQPNGNEFLPKPYTPATLIHRVRELLDVASVSRPDVEKGVIYESSSGI